MPVLDVCEINSVHMFWDELFWGVRIVSLDDASKSLPAQREPVGAGYMSARGAEVGWGFSVASLDLVH